MKQYSSLQIFQSTQKSLNRNRIFTPKNENGRSYMTCIKSSPASFITKQLSLLRVSLETRYFSLCVLQAPWHSNVTIIVIQHRRGNRIDHAQR